MSFKEIREKAMYALLIASLLFSGAMARKTIKERPNTESGSSITIESTYTRSMEITDSEIAFTASLAEAGLFNGGEYVPYGEDNMYTLYTGANLFIAGDNGISARTVNNKLAIVRAVEHNAEYSLVLLNDGRYVYVRNDMLIKCPNLVQAEYRELSETNDEVMVKAAHLYNRDGMYIGYVAADQKCQVIYTNGYYSGILLDDGRFGFVEASAVSRTVDRENAFGYIRDKMPLYLDKDLTTIAYYVDGDKIVKIDSANDKYCTAIIDNRLYYIDVNDLDKNFVVIDINHQRVSCFLDYELTKCFITSTGAPETPTDEISSAIDEKITNFTFTKFDNTYANYWILYNEAAEEGMHDLRYNKIYSPVENISDYDEYSKYLEGHSINDAQYMTGRSHGCDRLYKADAAYIYEKYNVGDMVIVRNDTHELLLNSFDDLYIEDTVSYNTSRSR